MKLIKINWIRIILVLCVLSLIGVTFYVGLGIVDDVTHFNKEKLVSDEASVQISEVSGEEYYTYGNGETRKNVEYNDIPQVMIDAVVAAEDARFFKHNGFDLPRIIKAFMGNFGGITSGASTITQQVIKKAYYPDEEKTYKRKIGEIILSIRASMSVSKEEMITIYLNKIYFGYGNKTVGIYAASKYYFGKSVQNLTLPEAALLAGALNSPNQYDPFANLDKAQKRRDTILDLMYKHGYISKDQCNRTKAIPVENTLKYDPIVGTGKYQAYADMVTREVYAKTGYDPKSTSMTIYTYMDPDIQGYMDDIASGKEYRFHDSNMDCGAIAQDIWNGRIVGVLSSTNYEILGTTNAYAKKGAKKEGSYGNLHQPGSSLKPVLAYASAFELLDYSTAHLVHDIPIEVGKGKVPMNFNNVFHGDITIKDALQNSWNGSAICTLQEVIDGVGKEKAIEYLENLGFDMSDEEFNLTYAMGSWTYGVTPQIEASAYATIANGGTYIESHCVSKAINNETGEQWDFDAEYNTNAKQGMSPESAFMIRDIMTDYVSDAKGAYNKLGSLKLNIGAKSGTSSYSSDLKDTRLAGKSKDKWMAAFSSDYAWSVWTGYPEKYATKHHKPQSSNDAKQVSYLLGKFLHRNGLKHDYAEVPEGLEEAECISGIYPYAKPYSGISSSRIAKGWFKKSNLPVETEKKEATISDLTSFTATCENGIITVSFDSYSGAVIGNRKIYKAGGKTWSLPYYGDLAAVFGTIHYHVTVTNAAGEVVYETNLSNSSGSLDVALPTGTYTVSGYYKYSNSDKQSNTMSATVDVTAVVLPPDDTTIDGIDDLDDPNAQVPTTPAQTPAAQATN